MYEFLEGKLISRSPGRLVLLVQGVGYDLHVPLGEPFEAPAEQPLRVFTHLAVREDAHTLYGFGESASRELFRLLLKVKKVGPAMALAILSGMRRDELLEAIGAGDAASLTRIKGVGRKTAEQILLDLSDRIGELAGQVAPPAERLAPVGSDPAREDAVAALVHIGFNLDEAEQAVAAAGEADPKAGAEQLIKAALRSGPVRA